MSKYITLIFVTSFLLLACEEEKPQAKDDFAEQELLSTDLVNNPNSAQGVDTAAMNQLPTMDFVDTFFNFGLMTDGERAVHSFKFINNGNSPLIIAHAKGSCGCTVADYPSKPIEPNGEAEIKVMFDSKGKSGYQEKTVTITTNTAQNLHWLTVRAEVTK